MKKLLFFILIYFWITAHLHAQVGKVGINTTTPSAMLHVKDSSVVFTGLSSLPFPAGKPPVSGSGIRMMWYPDKAAFRAGQVINNWDKDSIGLYSVAMGFNSKAKGEASAAIGNATSATGFSSAAFGSNNIASANSSLAMGVGTIASGIQSVSMGESTMAKSYASLVIGRYNETSNMLSPDFWDPTDPVFVIGNGDIFTHSNAFTVLKNGKTGINTHAPLAMLHVKDSSVVFTGLSSLPMPAKKPPVSGAGIRMMWYPDKAAFRAGQVISNWDKDSIGLYSVAMGFNSKAKGDASAAIGNATSATGFSSAAFGSGNIASANSSLAMGVGTVASGIQSVSMGESTMAKSYASLVIGRYNETSNMLSPDFWDPTDPVFVIGNGDIFTHSNAFTVLKNGKTGINTETPLYGLHVVGTKTNDGGWADGVVIENTGTTGEAAISVRNTTMPSNREWHLGLNQNPNLAFSYGAGFSGGNTRLLIDTTGQVGIGTISPAAKLDVNGTAILGVNGSALTEIIKVTVTKDVASIPANSTGTETFAVANSATTSTVYISPALALSNGLIIAYARVSVAGTVEVKFTNTTGAAINPASMDYYITVIR